MTVAIAERTEPGTRRAEQIRGSAPRRRAVAMFHLSNATPPSVVMFHASNAALHPHSARSPDRDSASWTVRALCGLALRTSLTAPRELTAMAITGALRPSLDLLADHHERAARTAARSTLARDSANPRLIDPRRAPSTPIPLDEPSIPSSGLDALSCNAIHFERVEGQLGATTHELSAERSLGVSAEHPMIPIQNQYFPQGTTLNRSRPSRVSDSSRLPIKYLILLCETPEHFT